MSRLRRIAMLVVPLLACLVLLSGCGSIHGLTPGPTPPARPGAIVVGVGFPETIAVSRNGGATWSLRCRGTFNEALIPRLRDVAFGDSHDVWAAEMGNVLTGVVLVSHDGGWTWSAEHTGFTGNFVDIAASGHHVWVVDNVDSTSLSSPWVVSSSLLASSDGGRTWQRESIPGPFPVIYDVAFSDARHGWAVTRSRNMFGSAVYSTADGGRHWRLRYSTKGAMLNRLACVDQNHCWVIGQMDSDTQLPGVIVATSDGGAHWTQLVPDPSAYYQAITFVDAEHGWAVGGRVILATTDGGRTWVRQKTPRLGDTGCSGVAFSDREHGWVMLGAIGLLATENGGRNWTIVLPDRKGADDFMAIACPKSG